jgi:hypothetical protein
MSKSNRRIFYFLPCSGITRVDETIKYCRIDHLINMSSTKCTLTPKQAEWTERFRDVLVHQGINGAIARDYVECLSVGRTNVMILLDGETRKENSLVIFDALMDFLRVQIPTIRVITIVYDQAQE